LTGSDPKVACRAGGKPQPQTLARRNRGHRTWRRRRYLHPEAPL